MQVTLGDSSIIIDTEAYELHADIDPQGDITGIMTLRNPVATIQAVAIIRPVLQRLWNSDATNAEVAAAIKAALDGVDAEARSE